MRKRFPRALYGRGVEPDPRFSLANERTFLAWVRTALALVAAGVALEALGVPESPVLRLIAASTLVALGLLASLRAWVGWYRAERALRDESALPAPTTAIVIALGVIAASSLVLVGVLA